MLPWMRAKSSWREKAPWSSSQGVQARSSPTRSKSPPCSRRDARARSPSMAKSSDARSRAKASTASAPDASADDSTASSPGCGCCSSTRHWYRWRTSRATISRQPPASRSSMGEPCTQPWPSSETCLSSAFSALASSRVAEQPSPTALSAGQAARHSAGSSPRLAARSRTEGPRRAASTLGSNRAPRHEVPLSSCTCSGVGSAPSPSGPTLEAAARSRTSRASFSEKCTALSAPGSAGSRGGCPPAACCR
mmetsp:Transcript_25818/g.72299  ORF Transcript_25818/g.72299 Transcript_25818/m.72299 type:complete len:250 (-) Transcript_25818:102-851(-)